MKSEMKTKGAYCGSSSNREPSEQTYIGKIVRNAHCSGQNDVFSDEIEAALYTPNRELIPSETQIVAQSQTEKSPHLNASLYGEVSFADQYEPPEDEIPKRVETKKRIRIPQIQSMDDYIRRHYTQELLAGALEDIRLRDGTVEAVNEVSDDTFYIDRMSFWRRSRTELIALLKMRLDACKGNSEKIIRYEYAAEIYFDFSDEIEYKEIICRPYNKRAEESVEASFKESMWLLDNYLVPYAKKDQIENRAWEMHCDFFTEERRADLLAHRADLPAYILQDEAIDNISDDWVAEQHKAERKAAIMREYNAFELAKRMGLQILRVALYKKSRRKSFFNFHESQVQVLQEGSEGEKAKPVWITVPADTIVINALRQEPDDGEMSVFHECIHWYWHYLFYRLQALHNSDISALQKDHEQEQDKDGVKESLSCMEYQANRGKYALKMPMPVMRPIVDALAKEYLSESRHEGEMLEKVARRIVNDRGIRPYQIRARLIQMGRIGAKGILNFEDGSYIAPFAFEHQNGSGDHVFFIRRKEALEEFKHNPEFKAQLQSGNFVYADGHICINDPRYVVQTCFGLRMTHWAKAHIDMCCLRFVSVYEMTELIEYEFGRLASDEEYNGHYVNYRGADGGEMTRAEQIQANYRYMLNLPSGFFEMLDVLRKDKGISQEKLEEKSGVSVKKLSRERARLKEKRKMNLSLDEAIALCIGLEAPPWLSKTILARANTALNPTDPLHQVYDYILSCMFMDSIHAVQSFLKESGFPELELSHN